MNKQKILVVRPDNMGDVVMTEPAIRSLKTGIPDSELVLLASSSGTKIADFISSIDRVITVNLPWVLHKDLQLNGPEEIKNIIETIKKEMFDIAVICTTYSQNALPTAMLCYMAGIPSIAAYCRENPYQLVNHWVPDKEPYSFLQHEVLRQCQLAASVGGIIEDNRIQLTIPDDAYDSVKSLLHQYKIDKKQFIVMHPGCSEEKRMYSKQGFIDTAKKLVDLNYNLIVTGTPQEEELVSEIVKEVGTGAVSFAGKLKLEELIALIDLCAVLITNNTGPAHLGAAVHSPVVDLYARTNAQHAPWKTPYKALLFDIDPSQESYNEVLQFTYPKDKIDYPTPDDIVEATLSLITRPSCPLPGVLW